MSENSVKKDWYSMSESAIIREMAAFIKQVRLKKNITQSQLSEKAGISRSTLSDFEHGNPVSLTTFIQLLRALDQLSLLESFTARTGISPLQLAKLEAKKRKRASPANIKIVKRK